MNFDLNSAKERQHIQLHELDKLRHFAYEKFTSYKERTKAIHDKKIQRCVFNVDDQVLLYNSRLSLFPGKLSSLWIGPYKIKETRAYGTFVLLDEKGKEILANGQRIKHYLSGNPIPTPTDVMLIKEI